ASELNAYLQASPTPDSSLKDPRIHFTAGRLELSFRLLGGAGSISTELRPVNGRLIAVNTVVRGWLSLIENGNDMQAVLDDALGRLPTADRVRQVTANADMLTIVLA
ncbi:MAG: hypothetical protein IVW57_11065, partial [Ktedonobacterales bacterium]|nr:hypothetical protein [Ktedonobacterales bacterium]